MGSFLLRLERVLTCRSAKGQPLYVSAASALARYPVQQEPCPGSSRGFAPESVADKIRVGGSATIRVVARSMSPWVRPGDQIFIRRYDFAQVAPGDIILYERANRLFVRRVIRRTGSILGLNGSGLGTASLVVKGDALNRPCESVYPREFLGRAIRVHRGNRHIDLESLTRTMLGKFLAKLVSWTTRFHPHSAKHHVVSR